MDKILSEIRSLLGDGVFLRPDREEKGLFVTDFPRRFPSDAERMALLLKEEGFSAENCGLNGDMWRIDLTPARYGLLLQEAQKEKSVTQTDETMALLYLARLFEKNDSENKDVARMLLHAMGKKNADLTLLYRALSERYACLLRTGGERPGKGCAGLIRRVLKGKSA